MMQSGAVSAAAHTALHLEQASALNTADTNAATRLHHTSLFAHHSHDHGAHHHDGEDDEGAAGDHTPDDHMAHAHGCAVDASLPIIAPQPSGPLGQGFGIDISFADPVYLTDHIPD